MRGYFRTVRSELTAEVRAAVGTPGKTATFDRRSFVPVASRAKASA